MEITAERVGGPLPDFKGEVYLYRLSQPVKVGWGPYGDEPDERDETEYVVVSGVYVPGSGDETYIFAADEAGNVLAWNELDGSFRGYIDHERAINGLIESLKERATA